VTERELQDWIVAAARLLGWRVAHFRPAPTEKGWRTAGSYDAQGWPDLCIVRDRVLFAEVKVGKNRLAAEQAAWLEALREAGAEAHVWTDADWQAGLVEAELRRERSEAA
jgi:hypothetical protein